MDRVYVSDLKSKRVPISIGNKAANLRTLIRLGCQVPVSYVITWNAYERYQQDDVSMLETLRQELISILKPGQFYAVRSSANTEDQVELSFAGQFKSVLNVQGVEKMMQAIWSIWGTTLSDRVQTYQSKNNLSTTDLKMAILIQEMVPPRYSGVAFSKNPMTGLDEILVEAVAGSGEALIQAGFTPDRYLYKWGEWVTVPESESIPRNVIAQVVTGTQRIADKLGLNIDLEWVYDGQKVNWVQVREITTLKNLNIYSNRMARDMLPGMIKPLIWSVNIPIVNRTWVDLLTEVIGPNDLEPEKLAKPFFYRAYFNVGQLGKVFTSLGLPSETLEMMMGLVPGNNRMPHMKMTSQMMRHLPRMLKFVIRKAQLAREMENFLPQMWQTYRAYFQEAVAAFNESELLQRINQLMDVTRKTAYYNIVAPLSMFLYNGILRRQLKETNLTYEELDLFAGMEWVLEEYNPGVYLLRLNQQFQQLDPAAQETIRTGGLPALRSLSAANPPTAELLAGFEALLSQFGHLSDSGNDFSSMPWRENPEAILKTILSFTPAAQHSKTNLKPFEAARLPAMKTGMVKNIYTRARQFRLYREKISSLYTFGYGLFRRYFLALGVHLVRRGLLKEAQQIFYLTLPEVQAIVAGEGQNADYIALSAQRQAEMEQVRNIVPPETIIGDQPPPVHVRTSQRLKGTATSRGYYTGCVTVVRGLTDFSKMTPGCVLVVPFCDVGWTPLFIQAGAVISESGGMLSHSSIIGREYGIPAVVSVPNATQLPEGQLVTVDGFKGEVLLHASSA